jgi:hypothetical protein
VVSKRALQWKQVAERVRRMNCNITSLLTSGSPAQFPLIRLNSRCSIKIHFEAPGG